MAVEWSVRGDLRPGTSRAQSPPEPPLKPRAAERRSVLPRSSRAARAVWMPALSQSGPTSRGRGRRAASEVARQQGWKHAVVGALADQTSSHNLSWGFGLRIFLLLKSNSTAASHTAITDVPVRCNSSRRVLPESPASAGKKIAQHEISTNAVIVSATECVARSSARGFRVFGRHQTAVEAPGMRLPQFNTNGNSNV